jgi:hypothetical protein
VEKYQEAHSVGKCSCGSLRSTVTGQLKKIIVVKSLVCSTALGTHLEIKLATVPLSIFGVLWGVSSKPLARERGSGSIIAALPAHPNRRMVT